MEGNRVRNAFAFLTAIAFVATAGTADAQVNKVDGTCRATIQKNAGKLGGTALKTIDGCTKNILANKYAAADCNNWTVADSAAVGGKGKIAAAIAKLGPAVTTKCIDATSPLARAEFEDGDCPSPAAAADNGGATTGVDTFAEVAACQAVLNTDGVEPLREYILDPDFDAIEALPADRQKIVDKCANSIGKNTTKLWSTVSKERAKCQVTLDKALTNPYDYACSTTALLKITDGVTKAKAAITKDCGTAGVLTSEWKLIGTCADDATDVGNCATTAVLKSAGGLTASAFEFEGECPGEVEVEVNDGVGFATTLDAGWTGFGHDANLVDGFVGRVNLSCSDSSCGSCTVTSNCDEGNCRCSHNSALSCSVPFTQDTCGAGNTCIVHFGPPLDLSAGGTPTCVVNTIESELVGTADVGTGSSVTSVANTAKVHLGISQTQPCPRCTGLTIGAAGTCVGGQRNGLGCTTNAINPTFGSASYDCPPSNGSNVTGTGLQIDLVLTDGAVSLPFGDNCDGALVGFDCACGACSLDPSLTCETDADCVGFGSCTNAGGTQRKPNDCGDLACAVLSGEEGTCGADPDDGFCDGFTKANGEGFIPCATNADCTPLLAGNCTLVKNRPCFLDPIEADGTAGQDGAELVSAFCTAPTASASVNSAGGLPGAGRVTLDFDFIGYCDDGVTVYELGGSNCP